jgi:hypothetical protein
MSVLSEIETDPRLDDAAEPALQWPTSLGLWLVALYLVIFLIRPWEVLMPWLQAWPVERIYAIAMLLAVMMTGRGLRWSPQSTTVLLFLGAVGLSCLNAWQVEYAWPAFYQYATVVVTYFVIVASCRQMSDVNGLIVTYIATMEIYLAKSLWEYFVHDRHEYAQGVSRLVGIEHTYGEPNAVAMSAVVSLPLWFYLWRCRQELTGNLADVWRRLFSLTLVAFPAVVLTSVALTNSRAGMVGLAAFIGLAIWYAQRHASPLRAGLLVAILLLGLWLVAPAEQKERLRTLWDPTAGPANAHASAGGRWEGFVAAMQMVRDRPLLGVGIGNFLAYRLAYVDGVGLVAHNLPGQILGELGWLGGGCFAALVAVAWRNTRRLQAMGETSIELDQYRQLALALQMTLWLLLLFGLSLHNGLRFNWLWIAAFACLAHEFCQREVQRSETPGPWIPDAMETQR